MNKDLGSKIKESIAKVKEAIEKPVETVGLSEDKRYIIDQVLEYIDNTTVSKLSADLTTLKNNEKNIINYLAPLKMAISLLKEKYDKTKVYKDLVASIKSFEKDLDMVKKQIERYNHYMKFTQDNIDKIKSHIDIEEFEDKVVWSYDTNYFENLIDLAILTIPLQEYQENKGEQ